MCGGRRGDRTGLWKCNWVYDSPRLLQGVFSSLRHQWLNLFYPIEISGFGWMANITDTRAIKTGVPQGSILFTIYTVNFEEIIRYVQYHF